MTRTVTVRLDPDLAAWLESAAARSGMSKAKLIRNQLERARASAGEQGFMLLAGSAHGPKTLSTRKGFSRS